MPKLTGTIAFVGGVLLIIMAITGVLIKNERQVQLSHITPSEAVKVAEADSEHAADHHLPQWLNIAMYTTLIVSGAFTIIQVSRFGLSTEPSAMSTAAFVGGMLLVSLGFLATLAVSEQDFRIQDKMEAAIIEAPQQHDTENHESPIPEDLRYLMMGTLFVAGGVTVLHVSKYGLA